MWEVWVDRAGESNEGKMGTTVIEQQLEKDPKGVETNHYYQQISLGFQENLKLGAREEGGCGMEREVVL